MDPASLDFKGAEKHIANFMEIVEENFEFLVIIFSALVRGWDFWILCVTATVPYFVTNI